MSVHIGTLTENPLIKLYRVDSRGGFQWDEDPRYYWCCDYCGACSSHLNTTDEACESMSYHAAAHKEYDDVHRN